MRLRYSVLLVFLLMPVLATGHPMGDFSINHHSRIHLAANQITVRTILDFAEIPTMQMFSDPRKAAEEKTREWVSKLRLEVDGARLPLQIRKVQSKVTPAPAGLPTLRVELHLFTPWSGEGKVLNFKDDNYPGRVGWKEVVIAGHDGGFGLDRSQGLTAYPEDPAIPPPDVVSAEVPLQPGQANSQSRTPIVAAFITVCLLGLYRVRKERFHKCFEK